MRKFINAIKIPLCAISLVVAIVFSVLLICVCSQPHGKEYSVGGTGFNNVINRTFSFEETTYKQYTYKNGELDSCITFYYEIENGNLYNSQSETGEKVCVGKIDSFNLSITLRNDKLPMPIKVTLSCKENIAQKNLYLAMVISFGVLSIISALFVIFVKKEPKQKTLSQEQSTSDTNI